MGNIGDNPREYEFEPFPAETPQPITVPAPVGPARTPEEVPA